MTRNLYRLIAAIGVSLGGLAALFLGIGDFIIADIARYNGGIYDGNSGRYYELNQTPSTIEGVLLIVVFIAAMAIVALLYTILKGREEKKGLPAAVLPLWLIEGMALISLDYAHLWNNGASVFSFILSIIIIAVGAIGYTLMGKGKIVAGRILTTVFLVVLLVGSIMGFMTPWYRYNSGVAGMVVTGNIFRILAVLVASVTLFARVKDDAVANDTSLARQSVPTVESAHLTKPKAEPVASTPVEAPHPAEPKQSLRDKLIEAKALYDEGLISEEEYAELKKQAIQNK